ncbi:hypothetical protein HMPREF0972_00957 [Actinomyces sp. oral taxon 848 str. F0332]|nr:hypothetical protein HMPREF0972_00957 [Actinomyces sp. oral taxon 848 str. F0332]
MTRLLLSAEGVRRRQAAANGAASAFRGRAVSLGPFGASVSGACDKDVENLTQ